MAINESPIPDHQDWFLQSWVNLANRTPIEFGVTLQVSGMLVSGQLVGGKRYFEGIAEDFSVGFSSNPETAEVLKSSIAKHGDIYIETENEEPLPAPAYIHLKDAKFFNTAGSPIPGNKGVWWRGRISEVGGFSLGSLSAASS